MTIPLQFASFYDRQEIFMWSNCLLDLNNPPMLAIETDLVNIKLNGTDDLCAEFNLKKVI